jgi:hypothetical protein
VGARLAAAWMGLRGWLPGPRRLGLGPWPFFMVKHFSISKLFFQFANYFEFKSNLNFE